MSFALASFTEQVRVANPIEDVIGEDVELKGGGRELVGRCPFHDDSTPSFYVNPRKGVYHCFACGGGDVFGYIMKRDRITFWEATLKLADRGRIPRPDLKPEAIEKQKTLAEQRRKFEDLLDQAVRFYQEQLTKEMHAYLAARSISEETIEAARIGYAPPGGRALFDHLKARGQSEKAMGASGLFVKKGNDLIDFYQGRLIFPYLAGGRPVYLIGRKTDETPDVEWERGKYKKQLVHNEKHPYVSEAVSNRYLYGVDTIRSGEPVFITEGIVDAIMAHQAGVACISPVTVRFAEQDHEAILQAVRRASEVYIANDNEASLRGEEGAEATAAFLDAQSIPCRLIELPRPEGADKIDLADYLADHTAEDLMSLAQNAKNVYRVRLDRAEVPEAEEEHLPGARDFVVDALAGWVDAAAVEGFIRGAVVPRFELRKADAPGLLKAWKDKRSEAEARERRSQLRAIGDDERPTQDRPGLPRVVDQIEGAPVPETSVIPAGWRVAPGGVAKEVWKKNDQGELELHLVRVCPSPLLIADRFRDIGSPREWTGLAWHRDGRWVRVTVPRETVATARTITALANNGLPVTSNSAKEMVQFLADYEACNLGSLQPSRVSTSMGWQGKPGESDFLPGSSDIMAVNIGDATITRRCEYGAAGDFEVWRAYVGKARRHPMVRLAVAVAFAAPLLAILGHRTFILHLWGDSGGGKTAAIWCTAGVWGDPQGVVLTFNATQVALERLAATYNDLPMAIDERQVANRQDLINGLVYMLSLGKGRSRGNRAGGLQDTSSWRTISITSGEEPLTDDASPSGVKNRVLEVYGDAFEGDANEAREAYAILRNHHGHAGPRFIARLRDELARNASQIHEDYRVIMSMLPEARQDITGAQVGSLALLVLADFYASQWVFGIEEKAANQEAVGLVKWVAAQLEGKKEVDQAARALEWVRSWIEQHRPKFTPEDKTQEDFGWFGVPGKADADFVYILPTAFRKCMVEGGFSERRVLRDFAHRQWVETSLEGGKEHYKVLKTGPNGRGRVVSLRPE